MNMNRSKHTFSLAAGVLVLAAGLAAGCAKEGKTATNEDAKRFMDAWVSVHHPEAQPTGLGVYVIDDQPGDGSALGDEEYVFIERTVTDLDGTVTATTSEAMAVQVGSYDAANYYGPIVIRRNKAYTETGYLEILRGMRVGGKRTAVIPGWLNVTADYATAGEYVDNESGDNVICTLRLVDKYDDIYAWEIDTLERFVARWMEGVDSTAFGYYYKVLKPSPATTDIPNDSTFYINYTGRLLNGKVFDTTVADTAKRYGIYSSTKSYKPVRITKNEDFTAITMESASTATTGSGSTLVNGFSYTLSKMRRFEKGICAFSSLDAYGYAGSGSGIPPHAPVCFEIELVDTP